VQGWRLPASAPTAPAPRNQPALPTRPGPAPARPPGPRRLPVRPQGAQGGAVATENVRAAVARTKVYNNSAWDYGGGVSLRYGPAFAVQRLRAALNMQRSAFLGNTVRWFAPGGGRGGGARVAGCSHQTPRSPSPRHTHTHTHTQTRAPLLPGARRRRRRVRALGRGAPRAGQDHEDRLHRQQPHVACAQQRHRAGPVGPWRGAAGGGRGRRRREPCVQGQQRGDRWAGGGASLRVSLAGERGAAGLHGLGAPSRRACPCAWGVVSTRVDTEPLLSTPPTPHPSPFPCTPTPTPQTSCRATARCVARCLGPSPLPSSPPHRQRPARRPATPAAARRPSATTFASKCESLEFCWAAGPCTAPLQKRYPVAAPPPPSPVAAPLPRPQQTAPRTRLPPTPLSRASGRLDICPLDRLPRESGRRPLFLRPDPRTQHTAHSFVGISPDSGPFA
jgi:hypothetical protein